ncbi:MAG: hypothetical protein M5R42_12165 [Rhodocyclaceae bacterium]|nr:hypothetical protein [Rhodocyclaceae bacterium]
MQYVVQRNAAAFAVHPVFEEEDDEAPSGARVFVLASDGKGGYFMRFVAGRFFSGAHAADDVIDAGGIPERVRELRFLPTRYEDGWFTGPDPGADRQADVGLGRGRAAHARLRERAAKACGGRGGLPDDVHQWSEEALNSAS